MTTREALMQRIERTFDAKCEKHPERVARLLEDICWQVDQWAREDERQAQAASIGAVTSTSLIDLRGELAVSASMGHCITLSPESARALCYAMGTGKPFPASPVSKQG